MKKILWLNSDKIKDAQKAELKRIFGPDIEIVEISQTIDFGKQVTMLIQSNNCSEAIVSLPPHLLMDILHGGYEPIRPVDDSASFERVKKIEITLSFYEKVRKIEITTEKL